MRKLWYLLWMLSGMLPNLQAQTTVREVDNAFFKKDPFWRGADGAATVALPHGKVLWLFSDTFVDQDSTGKRSNSRSMIRNSIAIQDSKALGEELAFYYGGTGRDPDDFFKAPGENWYWTGHGIMVKNKLLVFLMEETATDNGLGFEAVGWHVAIIENPTDRPDAWIINYYRGPDSFGVVVGSSAALQDRGHVYAFGVKEPDTHETYLLRFRKRQLVRGDLSGPEWWSQGSWTQELRAEPAGASLFTGQTEFSVHYDTKTKKYMQIQTHGYGSASLGYRLADRLTGPWSEPVLFYTPRLQGDSQLVYSANAHPELASDGLLVTYNVNDGHFESLLANEAIYFPRVIELLWDKK